MKTIKIRKSTDFSDNSKVYLHIRNEKIHIRGFESISLSVNPGDILFASQQWAKSNKFSYDEIEDEASFVIKPKLGKVFAFINLIILMICYAIFHFTRSRWSFFPFIPSLIYIALYLTVLKNRYLIIDLIKKE
jgi:hypothetical protein